MREVHTYFPKRLGNSVPRPQKYSGLQSRRTKSLNKNQGPLRCGWFGTKMTLEAKRGGSIQRDTFHDRDQVRVFCFCYSLTNDGQETKGTIIDI